MRKNWGFGLFIGMTVLFAVGIIGMLAQNPDQLLKSVLWSVLLAAVIGGIMYFFLQSRKSAENKKYEKALRQNKRNGQKKSAASRLHTSAAAQKKKNILPLRKRSKVRHLYVIEGKKDKKKA